MKYIIFVTGPPYGTQNAISSFLFSKALLFEKHQIEKIFFYANGTYNANKMLYPDIDDFNIFSEWIKLHKKHKIQLCICSGSAYRRGILSDNIGKKLGFFSGNLSNFFILTGLSELSISIHKCDRIIQF